MKGMTRATTSVCAAVVLVVAGLSGCGGGSGSGGAAAPSRGASSATASGTASGTPRISASSSPSAATTPAGSTFVESPGTGVRLALPDDWKVFNAKAISSGKDKALLTELEKTFSMNADELAQVFGQLDLMVVGPPEQKFAPNVNVVANGLTELPAATDLATQLGKLGATTGTPRDETTPLGPAIVVPYTLTSGGHQVKGRSIVLEGPQGFITVTVSHITDAGADAVTSSVLSTIGAS